MYRISGSSFVDIRHVAENVRLWQFLLQGCKKVFFKKPNPGGFGFYWFFWVSGFLGFLGKCVAWCCIDSVSNCWRGGPRFDSRLVHCQVTTLGKLFTHMCLCSSSSIIWYQPHHLEGKHMGEVWPTAHVTELFLHSLPAQSQETITAT